MKKTVCLLACLLAGTANAELIDFDTLPGGGALAANSILTNQYSSLGVEFSATEKKKTVSSAAVNSYRPLSGNYWANTTSGDFRKRHDVLSMTFQYGVENVSWMTNSFGSKSIAFKAYDSASNLLETISISGDWIATAFTSSGIYRIDALQPRNNWAWGLDNLSFDKVAAVPAPGTIALLGLAMAAIGFTRREKTA